MIICKRPVHSDDLLQKARPVLTDLNISRYLILRLDALPFKETAKGDSSTEQALGSGHRCAAGYPDVKRKVDGHLLTANQGWVLGEGGACTVHLWLQAVLDCLRHLPRWEREREGARVPTSLGQ